MLRLLARIVIFTMILTAPLSYTGDKCPDFRPDFRSQPQVQESRRVSINRATAVQTPLRPTTLPLTTSTTCPVLLSVVQIKSVPLLPLHGRAPPQHFSRVS